MAVVTSYAPWYVGDTYPVWDIPLMTDGGSDNITGVSIANFTLIFRTLNGVDTTGTGTFSVKTNSPAEIYYKPSLTDVASPFTGYIIIEALFPPSNSTTDKVIWDPIPFTITAV
jgi:hypothetical protein